MTVNWAWKQPIPARQKLVLLAVASDVDETGRCRSSVERLAERCSLGMASVRRQLDWLESRELLQLDGDGSINLPEEAIA